MCAHGRQKSQCKECGGSAICVHGRFRHQCQVCRDQIQPSTASTGLQDNKDLLGVEIDMRTDDFDGYVEGFGKIRAVKQLSII